MCFHTCTCSHMCTHKQTDTCVFCHPVQWLGALATVLSGFRTILGWWEQTSWKQRNGLICRFASGFDKSPCSKPKFSWPLVKNCSCLPTHPSLPYSFYEGEWITGGTVSLIKLFSLFHPPQSSIPHTLRQSALFSILAQLLYWKRLMSIPSRSKAQRCQGHKSKVNPERSGGG